LLTGYSGIVQCDGYQVYEQLVGPKFPSGRITLVSCWSHYLESSFIRSPRLRR
jgi:transposase